MKTTVCFYKSRYGNVSTWEESLKDLFPADYIQLTEYGEVELPDLPQPEVIERQLARFDAMEAEIDAKAYEAKREVSRQRQELLAITHKAE